MRRFFSSLLVLGALLAARNVAAEGSSGIMHAPGAETGGFFYGGGFLGVEEEFMMGERFALEFGIALIGVNGSLNFHFNPGPRSPYLSAGYANFGIGDQMFGATTFTLGKRWNRLCTELGLATPIYENGYEDIAPVIPFISLGTYSIRGGGKPDKR